MSANSEAVSLAAKIVRAMQRAGHALDTAPGEVNIVYVEGLNPDGTANDNSPNAFKDLRTVLSFVDGEPTIIKAWECTTAPGRHYTEDPLKSTGAAIIALGQQRCWKVGTHRAGSSSAHEALVQTGAEVVVFRDLNKDYKRDGDKTEKGWFGINQHWGYDQPKDDIGGASAGCLVGRTREGHREFMRIVKSDPRYVADSDHVFATTVMTAADVLAEGPAIVAAPASTVTEDQRQRMAKAIVDFEARRDKQGRLAVYQLPSGDGGGTYEVAGINDRYHPHRRRSCASLIEQGRYDEAEQSVRDYLLAYTKVASTWADKGPGVEFCLRDSAFNRGPTGASRILQRAVGADEDGIVGPNTRAATAAIAADELLTRLRAARESYERDPVGRDEFLEVLEGPGEPLEPRARHRARDAGGARRARASTRTRSPETRTPGAHHARDTTGFAAGAAAQIDTDAAKAAAKAALVAVINSPEFRAAMRSLLTKMVGSGAMASMGPLGILIGGAVFVLGQLGQVGDAGLVTSQTAGAITGTAGTAVALWLQSAVQRIASRFKQEG